jgi:hypothetical protein
MSVKLNVNGKELTADVDPQTPLLWTLRDGLGILGPKFGCGMGQCGACTVHVDGDALRSCVTPAAAVGNARITTIDGLRAEYEDGWGLVRASENPPGLGFRFEADDDQALERVQDQYRTLLRSVWPDLQSPF